MKDQNTKLNAMKAELKNIKAIIKTENERCQEVYVEYMAMEGKYGKKRIDKYCGMGFNPVFYVYDNETLKQKEERERKKFLKDNNYRDRDEIYAEYEKRIKELEEAICIEQYGMTKKEKEIRRMINGYENDIKRMKKQIETLEKRKKETEHKLKIYLENQN